MHELRGTVVLVKGVNRDILRQSVLRAGDKRRHPAKASQLCRLRRHSAGNVNNVGQNALAGRAAKRLGARPEECVVIEDAPSGLKAAQNAGMKCIGITSTFSADELKTAGADRTAEKTMMIVPLIKELFP